jgi:cold-inducible RNA-binding protein
VSNKLFVGGLSWDTTDESLRGAFEPFGEITEAKVILDRNTGRSRGFGFVTYTTEEGARNAMEALKDTELDGRTIRVDFANDRR